MVQFSDDQARRSRTAALVERLKTEIADGAYRPGSRLPSTRALAAELGVSRTTLTNVYEQLAAEGYIETARGARATVVDDARRRMPPAARDRTRPGSPRPRLSRAARSLLAHEPPKDAALPSPNPPAIDFRYGPLADADFPKPAWRRLLTSALLARQTRLDYGDPAGTVELRAALQAYLRRARGITCTIDQIVITQGSQQALDLCGRLLLDPGDAVGVEYPGYRMAALAFVALGARLAALPVDEHGVVTAGLDAIGDARMLLLTPSHQFPLGGILPIGRRLRLLEWAERRRAYLIEDDYDGEYRYDSHPVDALFSLDHAQRVLYIGTFSKTLSPQLRLGYLVAPPDLAPALARLKNVVDRETGRLEQHALARFIAGGQYERHVRRMRRRNARRRETLLAALQRELGDRCRVQGTEGGLHVVVWLPGLRASQESAIALAAARAGVGLHPIGPTYWRSVAMPHRTAGDRAGGDYTASDYTAGDYTAGDHTASDRTAGRRAATDRAAGRREAGFVLGYAALTIAQIDEGVAALRRTLDRFVP
ncbi:MAG: PLP-dependent aminotransferase family protein [Burkholderiaceae bacterium]